MDDDKIVFAQDDAAAHARRGDRRRRHLPRPVGGRRAEARDGRDDGARGRSSSRSPTRRRRSCPRRCMRCATTRSSPPAAPTTRTRSTTSSAFPYIFRGALDSGATTITVEMEIAAVHAIAELAQAEQSEVVSRRLRRRDAQLRPRVPDPEALRSAPDDADRAGGGAGGGRVGRRARGRSPTWRPTAPSCRPSSTRRARRCGRSSTSPSGAEEAHRLRRGRGGARAARGAGGRRREPGAADADRPARGDRAARRQVRPAPAKPVATTTSSTPRTTTATASYWQTYHRMTARKGVTAQLAKIEMRRRLTLIGAMLLQDRRGRRHAVRHLGRAPAMHLQLHRPGDRPARGRQDLRLHERR